MEVKQLGMTYVKCTQFLDVDRVHVDRSGIVGDRKFMLINSDNMPLSPGWHRFFLPLKFEFDESHGNLSLTYPDGTQVKGNCDLANEAEEIDFLGIRKLRVRRVLGDWNVRLSAFSGKNVSLVHVEEDSSARDILPITLFTTGSLSELEQRFGYPLDHRMFRSNLVIKSSTPFIEDSWEGKVIQVGQVKLKVRSSVPRCVVTQMDPRTGRNSLNTVAKLSTFRDKVHLPDNIMREYKTPGFASYAEVITEGQIMIGDPVVVIS
ncbi:MOSC domain-containing protein [Vibrio natriegens]|uniref:MOSC domain-containing protein n=1 Tax=Vibrio natriegens NBRC 15636 = ATCC 14048 = DSM 759 TaxID=1219067 RepID=A0AAN1CXT9_VIBNA|nr:MOSC domain-containing protein [Vibrio natriegens]ANQ14483.1 hypothetical protein BA890_17200 [Vibrio natriegens NBRC 15636 = ATCC 14048 = DSM 759]EPM38843.1 hypothetical protein M272_20750 [Vibrio natriegens NBRC 15636 = ATCC 14048 = DSM 759]MDX6028562.1 MOSC domain-containing protein [Vibrio natriegens NBRC 15636 = ATCC 14048 = DSM 759]UUI14711.1 MOSC domain-containing protein [Vibrio natriegens]WRS50478.1 MOSC domain-containing protein [Vibrio natriegens NBRC 15636 = ATCC 14048 = DSM 759